VKFNANQKRRFRRQSRFQDGSFWLWKLCYSDSDTCSELATAYNYKYLYLPVRQQVFFGSLHAHKLIQSICYATGWNRRRHADISIRALPWSSRYD